MAEYIEREKILDAISEQRRFYLHERDGETDMVKLYLLWGSDNALTTMEDIMSDIPPADVAPVVHGNWILEEVEFGISPITNEKVISPKYRCSNCGYETGKQAERFVCCPLCTARMRKDG